ncbi:MAG: sugar transferase [Kiritimatiellae bacterium]|nr:sugar transferase [Kiritimatiellia bacterium]
MKRAIETAITLVTAPLWMAAVALASLAVYAAMGRPVFFRQERAGLGGRPFRILKLRTMRDGAGTDAERLTRVGRFLRKTSLDELPQLFQVLSGVMSLVGPRPLPMRYLPRYTPEEARRHDVRPGITGWAQVNGRNAISWDEKLALDVWYVDHRSLALDAKILWLTVWNVLARRGIDSGGGETMPELRPGGLEAREAGGARAAGAAPRTAKGACDENQ